MTWTIYWWGVFGGAGAIILISYWTMKALWPTLKRNKWVMHDWESWS